MKERRVWVKWLEVWRRMQLLPTQLSLQRELVLVPKETLPIPLWLKPEWGEMVRVWERTLRQWLLLLMQPPKVLVPLPR
jgi:hypothetical protein